MTQIAIVDEYIKQGWSLIPIPPGTKAPRQMGWNSKKSTLMSSADLNHDYGIGLAHAYSGTMAFDIDEWDLTKKYGIPLDELYAAPDSVVIESGKPGHGKLLYKMPFGLILPTKKVILKKLVAFELRCATMEGKTVQDILPPTIHPEVMQPYKWAGNGHWSRLPMIPKVLLDIWNDLLREEPIKVNVDGVDASWEEIQEALDCVSPDCTRDEWINIGMALHWGGTQGFNVDQGLVIWDEWSRGSQTKYPGEKTILGQWASFRSDKSSIVTLGTLFHIARQYGWARAVPDASTLFSATIEAIPPVEVIKSIRPEPPDMDISLWPPILAKRAQEVGNIIGCDPLVPLFAGMGAICAVVDAQSRLELMPGFKVPPVLWLMTIGDPGDKKSPGSRPMLSPLRTIQAEDKPRFDKEHLEWQAKEAAYNSAHKAFIDFAASSEALMGGQPPAVTTMPTPPVSLKFTVSDITSQKLVREAADRPRGILCYLDEMTSWIKKLTEKSSGEDRSTWTVSYESEYHQMDRVGAGSIYCDNFAISIYGNIQPRILRENVGALSGDGLLQRFIPAVLRHELTRQGTPMPAFLTHEAEWEKTLRLTFALPAMTYKLSPEAYKAYRDFQGWYEQAKQDERLVQSGDTYMTAFGKLEGLVGRIALLFHIIEKPFVPTVDVDIINRVVQIVRSYIIPVYRYTLGEIGGASSFDLWMTDYIIQYCDKPKLTIAEIKKVARTQLVGLQPHMATQWVINAMYNLELAKWVSRTDDGNGEHKHHAEWMVNPTLKDIFKEHRHKVIRAKQRRVNYNLRFAEGPDKPRVYGLDDIEQEE